DAAVDDHGIAPGSGGALRATDHDLRRHPVVRVHRDEAALAGADRHLDGSAAVELLSGREMGVPTLAVEEAPGVELRDRRRIDSRQEDTLATGARFADPVDVELAFVEDRRAAEEGVAFRGPTRVRDLELLRPPGSRRV